MPACDTSLETLREKGGDGTLSAETGTRFYADIARPHLPSVTYFVGWFFGACFLPC